MIINNGTKNYRHKNSYNKVTALTCSCLIVMGAMTPIFAAEVKEEANTSVSFSENASKYWRLLVDFLSRKKQEVTVGVGGTVCAASLAGCLYQMSEKNKVTIERDAAVEERDAAVEERDAVVEERNAANGRINEANLRLVQANEMVNIANRERDEANRRAEQAGGERQEAILREEQANQEREAADIRAERANRERDEANRRAEQANRERDEANRRAEQAGGERDEANRRAEQADRERDAAVNEQNRLVRSAANDVRKGCQLEQALIFVYNGMPILKKAGNYSGALYGFRSRSDVALNYNQFKFLVDLANGVAYEEDRNPVWVTRRDGLVRAEDAHNTYLNRIRSYINPNSTDRNRDRKIETVTNLQLTECIAEAFFNQIIKPNYMAIATNNYQDIRNIG